MLIFSCPTRLGARARAGRLCADLNPHPLLLFIFSCMFRYQEWNFSEERVEMASRQVRWHGTRARAGATFAGGLRGNVKGIPWRRPHAATPRAPSHRQPQSSRTRSRVDHESASRPRPRGECSNVLSENVLNFQSRPRNCGVGSPVSPPGRQSARVARRRRARVWAGRRCQVASLVW